MSISGGGVRDRGDNEDERVSFLIGLIGADVSLEIDSLITGSFSNIASGDDNDAVSSVVFGFTSNNCDSLIRG